MTNDEIDFNAEMANLIESIGEPDIGKLKHHQGQINRIAEYCKTTGLYQHSEEQRNEFSTDINAVECYQRMILKIIDAPIQIMVRAAAILIIPVIADKLNDLRKDGHIRLKRWCDPGDNQEDCYDLTDYEVYYDSIKKQFKARFYCPGCGKLAGVFCYNTDRMHALLHELFEGIYCIDCFEQENSDLDYNLVDDDNCEIMEGVVCSCEN